MSGSPSDYLWPSCLLGIRNPPAQHQVSRKIQPKRIGIELNLEVLEDEWDAVMDVNVKGQLLCAQAVIPQMKSQEGGAIINTASVAGKVPFRDLAHYCASKYASIGLTQTLALELAPDDITVNAICPGIVETPMWTDVLTPSRDEPYDETIQNLMPLGRDQTPKDMGELAVYFATSENVTGQAVNVDGGMTINVVR